MSRPRDCVRLATIVVLVVVVSPQVAAGRRRPSTSYPRTIVTLSTSGVIAERDAVTGRVVHTIATIAPPMVGAGGVPVFDPTALAVSPDGSTIYTDRTFTRGCEGILAADVLAVDRSSGTVRTIASGRSPVLSPDGRRLAYVRYTPISTCESVSSFAVLNLATGVDREWSIPSPSAGGPNAGLLAPTAFAPDSRHVLASFGGELDRGVWTLDTDSPGQEVEAVRVPAHGVSVSSKYLGNTGTLVGLRFYNGGRWSLVTIDPHTGLILGTLRTDAGNGVDQSASTIAVDKSGNHLLLITVSGAARGKVARWSIGKGRPTRLVRGGIVSASWG